MNVCCFVQSSEMEEVENVNNGAASPGSVTSTTSKRLERQVNEDVRVSRNSIKFSYITQYTSILLLYYLNLSDNYLVQSFFFLTLLLFLTKDSTALSQKETS